MDLQSEENLHTLLNSLVDHSENDSFPSFNRVDPRAPKSGPPRTDFQSLEKSILIVSTAKDLLLPKSDSSFEKNSIYCESAEQALPILAGNTKIARILIDLSLPNMGGFHLLHQIPREHPHLEIFMLGSHDTSYNGKNVTVLSRHQESEKIHQAMHSEFLDHPQPASSPLSFAELLLLIEQEGQTT
ncbi:MAG: hypothetical protein KJ950_14965 [Proteobacteria bacterium]|nr:hypothetical protein [Pseudomonadota bacterium]MBU1688636.1 hypothetical protein [Pseudomonadota bacterium]